jgi:hypothetical protein
VLLRSRPAFLSSETAEVVVQIERSRTTKEDLRTAVDVVRQMGSEVVAVVLVRGRPSRLRSG